MIPGVEGCMGARGEGMHCMGTAVERVVENIGRRANSVGKTQYVV